MRITQVNLQPDYGGAERYTRLLAEGLRARGHEVALLCHPRGRLRAEAQECGLPTACVAARSQADLRAAAGLAAHLRRLRPEILHLQTSKEYLSGFLAARLARVPVVVVTRHMLVPVKPVMRRLFRRLDGILVLSNAVRDNLVRYGVPDEKIHVVYAGIETEAFTRAADEGRGRDARRALGIADDRTLIGLAGRLVDGKGQADLLDAMARLPSRADSEPALLLIGEGPLRPALERQAQALGLADRVIFTGFQSDVSALLAGLDVFVMASTVAEVMPMVLMEAMAAGRPVVATDVGGVSEIVTPERTGLLTPSRDPDALAGALGRLVADPALRARLSAAGRADVLQRFSLPRMISEMEQWYHALREARRG